MCGNRCQQTRGLDRAAHSLSFNSRPCLKTQIDAESCLHPRSSLGTAGTEINKVALPPPTSAGATHPLPRFPHSYPQFQELPRTDPPTPTYPRSRCEPEPPLSGIRACLFTPRPPHAAAGNAPTRGACPPVR